MNKTMRTTLFVLAGLATSTAATPQTLLPGSASNPLATRAQLAAELLAKALSADPEIQSQRQLIGQEWRAQVTPLLAESLALFPDALDQLGFLSVIEALNADVDRPKLLRIEVLKHHLGGITIPGTLFGINNPDTIYRTAHVDGASSYVITGRRAPVPPIDTSFSVINAIGATTSSLSGAALQADEDGRFAITIDANATGTGNHLQIPAGPSELLIRETLSDWSTQRPSRLSIRRADGPAASPPPPIDSLEQQAVTNLSSSLATVLAVEKLVQAAGVNTLAQPVVRTSGGFLATQANSIGHFVLRDDQAYVLTLRLGGAAYMTFPVNDAWEVQDDFVTHTTSLNNAQAAPNPDGTYTFVLSPKDPGVYNWIDPVGQHEVVAQPRWQGLPTTTPAAGGPAIVSQAVVDLSQLRANLPPGTVFVTPAQRQRQQQERARSFAWRDATG